jgi:N-methylhydantoinase A
LQTFALGIDIGGTFTDVVLLERTTGTLSIVKLLTTYPDPSDAVLVGTRRVLEDAGCDPASVDRVLHGTTLVTNTLIERKGAFTGLITTDGFRDALEIGREGRYDIYDLWLELPVPLVQRRHRVEVTERINPDGSVRVPLDEASVGAAVSRLRDEGIEAIAVCLLHAYANPDHERRVRDIIRSAWAEVPITCSHDVAPELREYERSSTTVANAYVQPLAERYLERLEAGLEEIGLGAPLHIMLSNGGSCSTDTARRYPIRLVESGPCGGALAAAEWGRQCGTSRVLAFDMGGTTAKAVLSDGGEFPVTTESEVARVYRFKKGSGLPLLVPVLDMIEIGAGGGSVAHLNELGLPAVGPESAGSSPGPACYDQGGRDPTVTDADLVLGYLDADHFLGGEMALDEQQARDAIGSVADSFGGGIQMAARGIHQLVNENMANAARVHAAERGVDIRPYTMVATGGAGPGHATGVARLLGLSEVVVPPVAGVGSAYGLLLAPVSFDFARTQVGRLEGLDPGKVNALYSEMEADGREVVREGGVEDAETSITRTADMRYVGQGHEIRVRIPSGDLDRSSIEAIQDAFDDAYRQAFGRICDGVPVETVHWRVTVSGPKPEATSVRIEAASSDAEKGVRDVLFDGRDAPVKTPVYSRYALRRGFSLQGPAIVEEAESTTVVPPGWHLLVHDCGALVLTHKERTNV